MDKKVRHLSSGQQKKLQMVIAMIGEPDLYILDEPTAGLNPNAAFEMKSVIKGIQDKGKSIIISSHILGDMDEICTNIAIMEHGQLTYNNEIESFYIIRTSAIPMPVFQKLSRHMADLDSPGWNGCFLFLCSRGKNKTHRGRSIRIYGFIPAPYDFWIMGGIISIF